MTTLGGATLARLERLLLIVPWLLEHPGAELDEVAARFGVDPDELARDLDLLGYCGLPGYGGGDLVVVRIAGGRVTVAMADFFARPLALTLRQAVTLLLAGQALEATGLADEALQRATRKLVAALGTEGLPVVVDVNAEGNHHLPLLRRAVAEGTVVSLAYRSASKGEETVREVEPWGLVGEGGAWHLQGWCRLARAPRDFRVDRIRAAELTDDHDVRPAAARARAVYEPEPGDPEVRLALAPPAWWVAEWVRADKVEDTDAQREVTFRVASLDWAARLVIGLGGDARVLAPEALRRQVQDHTRTLLTHHGA